MWPCYQSKAVPKFVNVPNFKAKMVCGLRLGYTISYLNFKKETPDLSAGKGSFLHPPLLAPCGTLTPVLNVPWFALFLPGLKKELVWCLLCHDGYKIPLSVSNSVKFNKKTYCHITVAEYCSASIC